MRGSKPSVVIFIYPLTPALSRRERECISRWFMTSRKSDQFQTVSFHIGPVSFRAQREIFSVRDLAKSDFYLKGHKSLRLK